MSIIEFVPVAMAIAAYALRFYLSAPLRLPKAKPAAAPATKAAPSRLAALFRRARIAASHGGVIRA